jgi:hypothetical protein
MTTRLGKWSRPSYGEENNPMGHCGPAKQMQLIILWIWRNRRLTETQGRIQESVGAFFDIKLDFVAQSLCVPCSVPVVEPTVIASNIIRESTAVVKARHSIPECRLGWDSTNSGYVQKEIMDQPISTKGQGHSIALRNLFDWLVQKFH